MKGTSSDEVTLCAWCGEKVVRDGVAYNKDIICGKCFGAYLRDKRKVLMLRKGVTNGKNIMDRRS